MEVILLKDVEKVGRKGDVLQVRDGFARNYLLARGLALRSNKGNQKFVEDQKLRAQKRREKEKAQAEVRAKEIQKIKLTLPAKVGESGKLFGSVTAEDIREALHQKGYTLDKKQIQLQDPIRSVGVYSVTLELFPQVKATIQVEVVRES